MKIPEKVHKQILKEMLKRERNGKPNGLDGLFLCLAQERRIYPDDIIKKYNLEQYDDCYKDKNDPDGWEGDLINQL